MISPQGESKKQQQVVITFCQVYSTFPPGAQHHGCLEQWRRKWYGR